MKCWKCNDGKVKVECWRCEGKGYLVENCSSCSGDGWAKCWTCDGAGKDADGHPHTPCEGTGRTRCEAYGCEEGKVKVECSTCNGLGYRLDDCVTCGGDGEVD